MKSGQPMRHDFFMKFLNYGWPGLRSGALLFLAGAVLACGGAPPSTIGRSAVSVAQESRAESGQRYTLGPQFTNQLQDMLGREAEALGGSREGVPLELNRQVLLNINRFLNEDRGFITRSLNRGSKYLPMMKSIFRRKGLPEDLVYLALIESGFNTQAVSHASAVGFWQFIPSTGRRYGLVVNDWVDERRDPVRATYAAADYLITLHDTFGSWPLAIAAYNSGEGKIIRGIRNYGVSNFWDMSSVGGHLADETKIYVPSFLAATFIAKDPAAYGLTIDAQPPEQWEEVSLPQPVTLAEAAQFARADAQRLQELNPHLRKAATPPKETGFILRLPKGSGRDFIAAYQKAGLGKALPAETPPPVPRASDLAQLRPGLEAAASTAPLETPMPRIEAPPPQTHRVVRGDTLGGLAVKYKTTVRELTRLNELKSDRLTVGQRLKVRSGPAAPTQVSAPSGQAAARPAPASPAPAAARAAPSSSAEFHTVVEGDTLGALGLKYGVKVKDLMEMNDLTGTNLRLGRKLRVKAAPVPPAPTSIKVAEGDTLYVLARKHGLSVDQLKKLNNLTGDVLRPGQTLKIK
ncbi:MAG: LysM peptidoglycan-binding domain-containing protein [Candidatus Adiutrix sp.]|jgi:membrane-bound lytic murein transglycosylase D|nr:LysM peptidoglycan-binding domain-containing protein [Candidatus Adiutrix sp.]